MRKNFLASSCAPEPHACTPVVPPPPACSLGWQRRTFLQIAPQKYAGEKKKTSHPFYQITSPSQWLDKEDLLQFREPKRGLLTPRLPHSTISNSPHMLLSRFSNSCSRALAYLAKWLLLQPALPSVLPSATPLGLVSLACLAVPLPQRSPSSNRSPRNSSSRITSSRLVDAKPMRPLSPVV